MKFLILACVAAVAVAAPQYSYDGPRAVSSEEREFVPILKDDRVHEEDGTYNFDFEAANGISFSQAGSPDGDEDAVIKAGEYSYTAPDGTEIHLRFVADENGFQPQGAHLPVAPEFPTRSLSSSSTRSPSPPRRTASAPAVMTLTKFPLLLDSTATPTKF
nr:cuticle protein CP14.6-like isoform X1 [Penaeus vannamei]XP_027239177.1 cuticle protein CP14.6-like isoform X2 [Penaeus vannamei]